MPAVAKKRVEFAIWLFAFGYFAAYVPYSALTKALSSGMWTGEKINGLSLLPVTTFASLVGMFVFISAMGWWRFAGHRRLFGLDVPVPSKWTFLSGLATAAIIATTTLAYTFAGASIVLMMLFMRGGVLVLAPIVDALAKRHVRWFSWTALGLSLAAVLVATLKSDSFGFTVAAAVDVALYLAGYFIRLRFMSHLAKSDDPNATKRYFVEEQMVATPAIVSVLALAALAAGASGLPQLEAIREGFTGAFSRGTFGVEFLVGILSQGTGVFGALVLLNPRENSFCVPVNRASSVLAGIVASGALAFYGASSVISGRELLGAVLMIVAMLVLGIPPLLERRRRLQAAREAVVPSVTPAGT